MKTILCTKFATLREPLVFRILWRPSYYAVKKVSVKLFAEFFEVFAKFFKVFASFLRFSRAFRGFRIHLDPWDAFGCIRKQLEAFGRFRKFLRFFGFLSRFSTFPDVIFTKDFFHGTTALHPEMLFLGFEMAILVHKTAVSSASQSSQTGLKGLE